MLHVLILELKSQYLPLFNVPYRRNLFFTGRADVLETIHKRLVSDFRSDLSLSYVIYGLGGVGKTQVAIEYSYQHRNDFDIIYWLRADDYKTLLASYFEIYEDDSFRALTGLKLEDENDLEKISTKVKLWFERCRDISWLLVLDNAEPLPTIANLIPSGHKGCVLVTSRDRSAIGQLATDGKELLVMEEAEATKFMMKCSKADSEESEDAVALVQELGRLPLAIEQAGGCMRHTGTTIAEYRRLYNINKFEALGEGLSATHRHQYYRETVRTTWSVSFTAIHESDCLAGALLLLAAFLDGREIPKDLFYNSELNVNGKEDNVSEWKVNQALATLMSYSLVRPVKGRESIEMHPLVQNVIRDDPGTDKLQCFVKTAELIRRRFPWGGNADNRKGCLKYLSQAQNCVEIAECLGIENSVVRDILESLGRYMQLGGHYNEAFAMYNRALTISERGPGVNPIHLADIIYNIGLCASTPESKIFWYERALRIYEGEFGVGNINLACVINSMGLAYSSQRRYREAIHCHERALVIFEQEYGVGHSNLISVINNIGSVYHCQGMYIEAILWYGRALEISELNFGLDHVEVAYIISQISIIYQSQGQNTEAVMGFERALKIYNQEFKGGRIKLNDIIYAGNICIDLNKGADAILWYERALTFFERELDVNNIHAAHLMNNIGAAYSQQNRHAEAILWHERALKIVEQEHGVGNMGLVPIMQNISSAYESQKKYVEANTWKERALEIDKEGYFTHNVM